jgi:hypothetical protein
LCCLSLKERYFLGDGDICIEVQLTVDYRDFVKLSAVWNGIFVILSAVWRGKIVKLSAV